ncbi:hypothetical protein PMIN04_008094 [Paraphaeosphaeria minitans]
MPSGYKASLGSLVYTLDNLPTFYVAEIETVDKDKKQCLSRKLRCSAVRQFLNEKLILGPFAVNHNAKRNQLNPSYSRNSDNTGPIDHLIFRCESMKDIEPTVMRTLQSREYEEVPEKEIRRTSDGTLESSTIRCRFVSGTLVRPGSSDVQDQKLYSRCLDTFICTEASKDVANRRKDTNPANKEWLLPNFSEFATISKKKGLAQYCSFMTRAEPVLKLDAKELHLNLDLVLCLDQNVMVPDLLFEYLGNSILGPVSAEHLSLIRGSLTGQEVTYLDPEKSEKTGSGLTIGTMNKAAEKIPGTHGRHLKRHDSKLTSVPSGSHLRPSSSQAGPATPKHQRSLAKLGSPSPSSQIGNTPRQSESPGEKDNRPDTRPSQEPRNFKIQDIQSSAEVSKFISQRVKTGGPASVFGEAKAKPISIIAYFQKVKKANLKYAHLPLAKVGQDTWIPLEFLQLRKGQMLRNTGHLTDFVNIKTPNMEVIHRETRFDKIDRQESLLLKDDAQQLLPLFKQSHGSYVKPMKTTTRHTPREPEVDLKCPTRGDDSSLKAHFIYIPSTSAGTEESEEFLESMSDALHQATNSEGSLMKFAKPYVTLLEIEKPLLLDAHLGNEEHDVIIAIVDDSGRTKAAVDEIRAEIHKYAEQVVGCIALCVSKRTLDKSFRENSRAGKPYFPRGLLHKINFMLGGTNHKLEFETGPLHAIAAGMRSSVIDAGTIAKHAGAVSSAMILGAHVSHPGSSAGVSCPSVAAVVGTKDSALHYFGAARLQPNMRRTSQRKGYGRDRPGIKHIMQSRILGLNVLIKEQMYDKSCSSVIFFRHGLDPDSQNDVIEKEKADIIGALVELGFDRQTIKLTYIVVSHNSRTVRSEEPEGQSGFAVGPKYWYSIKDNELQIKAQVLQDMVKRLNQSNQLGAEVSVALPIHFAQKLARRVFDYFHYYATDSASIVPDIIRPSYHKDRHDGYKVDQEMRALIQTQLFRTSGYEEEYEPEILGTEDSFDDEQIDEGDDGFEQSIEQDNSQADLKSEVSEDAKDIGDDKEPTAEEEVELNEQEQIDRINSIEYSPWHENLNHTMFYL